MSKQVNFNKVATFATKQPDGSTATTNANSSAAAAQLPAHYMPQSDRFNAGIANSRMRSTEREYFVQVGVHTICLQNQASFSNRTRRESATLTWKTVCYVTS
jgi:hypothetical protein